MNTAFKVSNIGGGEARMELSDQWAKRPNDERFLSIDELWSHLQGRNMQRAEKVHAIQPGDISFDGVGGKSIKLRGKHLSNWSFGQLAQRAGAPASYLRTLQPNTVVRCLAEGLTNEENDTNKFYYSADQIHAITSPSYGRILDSDVVTAIRRVAGNGINDTRWKIPGTMDWRTMIYDPETPVTKETTTLFASDRDVWCFLVDDRNPIQVGTRNGEPDYLFRGFYCWNSEVGASTAGVATFYLRSLCCNRIMWGVEQFSEVRVKHTRFAPDRLARQLTPTLQAFGNASTGLITDGVQRAREARIGDTPDEAVEFLRKLGLSAKRAGDVLRVAANEEYGDAVWSPRAPVSIWDAAQGITAVARSIPHQDERVGLEAVGKKLLDKVK